MSHEVTERYYPQSNGLAERLNLTIMDMVRCMLIDANLTPKLWSYAAHYAVLIYNNLPHSALDNHKSPSNPYGDSFDFLRLYVFGSIFYALQPSKLLDMLEERSAKELFLGIDPAGYKVLDLQSKVAYVARTVKRFDGKFISEEENQIHGLCREEEPTHSSSLYPTPARAQRKTICCRPHLSKNASTSRARTGRQSHKHPGIRG
jgi:hypothetical protein